MVVQLRIQGRTWAAIHSAVQSRGFRVSERTLREDFKKRVVECAAMQPAELRRSYNAAVAAVRRRKA
jgi:hypothetical protein